MKKKNNWLIFGLCGILTCYLTEANSGTLYTVGYLDGNVYSVDTVTGSVTTVTPSPLPTGGPVAIKISSDRITAYVSSFSGVGEIDQVNLQNGSFSQVPLDQTVLHFPTGMAFQDSSETIGFVGSDTNGIFKINFPTNQVESWALTGQSMRDIGIADSFGYSVDVDTSKIYQVDLTAANTAQEWIDLSLVANSLGFLSIHDVASGPSYAASEGGNIYRLDLAHQTFSLVTPSPVTNDFLFGLAVDGTTGYIIARDSNEVIVVDLTTGDVIKTLATIPGAGLSWAAFLPDLPPPPPPAPPAPPAPLFIQLAGLTGNNLALAKYLNTNAPENVREAFAKLSSGLSQALESAAPTRNAFLTFASQNGFLASSQVLKAHSRKVRFISPSNRQNDFAFAENLSETALVANACEQMDFIDRDCCEFSPGFTIWAAPFGEFAKEKKQHQTPAFNLGAGGVFAATDYLTCQGHVLGFGGAYVFTHIDQHHSAGHANLNQGYITAYGSFNACNWYLDANVWGGYYSGKNTRHIDFDDVHETARAKIHGWQFATHAEVGYNAFYCPGQKRFGVEPFVAADWVGNWEKGFHEHGADGFNMGQHGRFASFLRVEPGLRFTEVVYLDCGGHFVFQETGSYVYKKGFDTGSITAFLVGSPGSFSVSTLTGAQNLGLFAFSMMYVFSGANSPYIEARYEGEFGSEYQSHLGSIEFGKKF